jgi:flagellar motor switch protein FliM
MEPITDHKDDRVGLATGPDPSSRNGVPVIGKFSDDPADFVALVQTIFENVTRRLEGDLSALLNATVQVQTMEIAEHLCGDFFANSCSGGCNVLLKTSPCHDTALLNLDSTAAFAMIEMLMGGQPAADQLPVRQLTDVERDLLSVPVEIFLQGMGEACGNFGKFAVSAESSGAARVSSKLAPPSELVTVVKMRLWMGDGVEGVASFVAPNRFWIELALQSESLDTHRDENQEAGTGREMLDLLLGANLELEALLQVHSLALADILALEPGKVCLLHYSSAKPVRLTVNGCQRFEGHIAVRGNRRVLQLDRPDE